MYRSSLALAGLATMLASCGGNSAKTTMDLLREGDAKVCIAGDVEQSLRKMLLPKEAVPEGFSITFSDATLETYDKVVSKAACHANLKIDGPFRELVERTGFDFTIVPSAQNPDTFVVAASLDAFAERLAVSMANEARAKSNEEADRTKRSKLVATVKDGWLLGRWVVGRQGSDACASGPYVEFGRNHRYAHETGPAGTWKLTDLKLKMIGTGSVIDLNITDADSDSFNAEISGSSPGSFRRCSRAEAPPPAEDETEAEGEGYPSEIEAENPTSTVEQP